MQMYMYILIFTPFFKTVPETACLKDSRKKAKRLVS